ncbi:uncharacterized protein LOC131459867 [Solea solea]|uniref:uncharacterized protein LOC131458661 n=1 Tax=Solea solea TaxID=90069 RepID=UPI00272AE85D|nr:uncharacterized protein LOC131458661 [Solea solea]XP_058485985.1 uncharacterized protein LOC131459867 [Solea solea]
MKPPRFNGVLTTEASGEAAEALESEISSLLSRGAVRIVPEGERNQGFYSRYFLIPKKGGSLRPILDLRCLNLHLRKYKFKMLTHNVLFRSIRPGDWFTSVDLQDAYFHISIYPAHRKYLRFAFKGAAYEYQTLPFGLSLAPRVFSKCVEAALNPVRASGLRVFAYLDDFLLCAPSREEAGRDTQRLIVRLSSLGFSSGGKFSPSLGSLSAGKFSVITRLSSAVRADGIINFCRPSGTAENEGFSALGNLAAPGRTTSSQTYGEGFPGMLPSSPLLERPGDIHFRRPTGSRSDEENSYDRCLVNGVGSGFRGEVSERDLAPDASPGTYKLPGAVGCFPGTQTFSASPGKVSCVGQSGQHNSRSLHKQTGRHALCEVTQAGSESDIMGQRTPVVVTRGARAGCTEQRSGFTLQRESPVWRVETEPRGAPPGMGEVRPSVRRSLRIARKRTVSPVFLVKRPGRTAGCGRTGAPVAKRAAVCVSSARPHHSDSDQSEGTEVITNPDSSLLAQQTVDGGADAARPQPAMAVAVTRGLGVTSARADFSSTPRTAGSLGLARERVNLQESGLPSRVIETIQCARAPSTRSLYDNKWRVFERWCEAKQIIPFQCSVPEVLCFLQDLMDGDKAFSTIKVYLAAVSACHVGFGGAPVGQHPLIKRFMRGARRLRPVRKPLVPSWDLPMVLEALSGLPFEPLEFADLKVLSLKTILLLALTSASRIGELHALSVHDSCMQFSADYGKVILRPNPAFVPKVSDSAYSCSTLELLAFHPPPFAGEDEKRLNALCPVRALRIYVDRTKGFRKSNQLFVSWAPSHRGRAPTRQRLSHWVVQAIILAHESRGLQPPDGLRAHSTRGIATSWALFRGVSVRDICAAASWASPHTFIRFYRLDVTKTSLAHSVLSVGSG